MNKPSAAFAGETLIRTPGKFEGCETYVPYFWDLGLNGEADVDDGTIFRFRVSKEDKLKFPSLKNRKWVALIETDQGFVCEI